MSPLQRLDRFRSSFQYRLFLVFTLLTALVSSLFSTLYVVTEIHEARTTAAEQLRLTASTFSDDIRLALYAENCDTLTTFARELARSPRISGVIISSASGKQLVSYRPPERADGYEPIVETMTVAGNPLGLSPEDALSGSRVSPPRSIGTVRLERSSADLVAMARQKSLNIFVMAFGFWFLVSLLCHLVLRRVTASFNALMEGIERVRRGNYDTRIQVRSEDEPGMAGHAINELAAALRLRNQENERLNKELVAAVEEERASRNRLASTNRALEQEIGERLLMEQALRESESNLRTLMDMMPVGVSWSLPGGRVEYVNQFILRESGYDGQDLTTTDEWYKRVFPDPRYRAHVARLRRDALARAATAGEIPSYDARVTCRDGSVRHVLFRHQVCMERNVAIMVDVTERELLQEQMVKSQKLESLGVLAGGIAHNFNNVLTGVMGYISYARLFLDPSTKSHGALENAEDACRRASGMANQLLTFARGGEPIKRLLSVQRLVEECLSLTLNNTTVRRVVEIPPELHSVMADEAQLAQAFNNIIVNAAQAMEKGGTLTVRGENVRMLRGEGAGALSQSYVSITFSDEGEGIPATVLPKIFDPYFTTKSTGTGLGLASAHSIVTRHGGMIRVDSQVGSGASFTVLLPSMGETLLPAQDAPSRRLKPGGQGSGRVLVMDDEESIREFARESLLFLGYRVTCCGDGRDAVRLYCLAEEEGDPFFAAILDLTVPGGMGGTEAAHLILKHDPSARLIVSSGYSYDPIMSGYREHGFCAAVSKPYKVDQLGQELSFLREGEGGCCGDQEGASSPA